MKRVCFIGASTVEGVGDERNVGWAGRLADKIRNRAVSYNLGIRGQTLGQIQQRAEIECRARIPDPGAGLIVVCCGVNDLAFLDSGERRVSQDEATSTLEEILKGLNKIAAVLAIGPAPVVEEKMPFYAAAMNTNLHFKNAAIAAADNAYDRLAQSMTVDYLSVYAELSGSAAYIDALKAVDGLHPNGSGYQVQAELIAGWPAWQKHFPEA